MKMLSVSQMCGFANIYMLHQIIVAITTWITHVISALGYPGVGLLMAIESAAIPLPSEVIMPFAGFSAASGHFNLLGLALAGAIGSTIGSLVTYYIGYHGGRIWMQKYERVLHVSEGELGFTEKFFNRFPLTSTLVGRVLPVVRTFISIPAGIAKVPVGRFLAYAFIGSFVWSYFLAFLGKKLGDHWDTLGKYFHQLDAVIVGVVAIAIIWWLWHHFGHKKRPTS
jgi:membrane protein DedA with SNARE-associated domain